MGWRDTVTEQAQADLDGLVDAAVSFAAERIAGAGEFLPFALAVSAHGQRQAIAPNYPRGRDLQVADQLAAQWSALIEVKDSLRAAVVAVNVTLTERNRDGIELTAEHREGVAIGLIFPYTLDSDGRLALDSPSAHRAERRVWVA
ncbi:hypothetical protein [Mycobacterium paraffinicum]|uniref:Uncharacterized protein n=1 Tax=Mycobacterium paraffinicum TaxID=53378 RepID=A0ABP8RBW3_9MYCO|nr:hypothetical protein [Mycobacterium paraffinicum]MCV7313333.1 hypothetical protein [Mycobacterium paraffinicum]